MTGLPAAERAYLAALVERLGETVAVILSGSAAAGAYAPGASDLDVTVVAERPDVPGIAERCAHATLPCPARKLELVVYEPGRAPRWSLNLNTGAGVDHVGTDPAAEPSHWFVLDLVVTREHGVALAGPPPADVLPPVPDADVRTALAEAVAWYAAHEPGQPALTAAARAWHWGGERPLLSPSGDRYGRSPWNARRRPGRPRGRVATGAAGVDPQTDLAPPAPAGLAAGPRRRVRPVPRPADAAAALGRGGVDGAGDVPGCGECVCVPWVSGVGGSLRDGGAGG